MFAAPGSELFVMDSSRVVEAEEVTFGSGRGGGGRGGEGREEDWINMLVVSLTHSFIHSPPG